jgi:hypothetical protein
MIFDYKIPRARFKPGLPLRGPKFNVVETWTKVPRCARTTAGNYNRRLIVERKNSEPTNEFRDGKRVIGEYEYSYHATKGWRRRRA